MLPGLALGPLVGIESLLAVVLGHDMGPDEFQCLFSSPFGDGLRVVMDPEEG